VKVVQTLGISRTNVACAKGLNYSTVFTYGDSILPELRQLLPSGSQLGGLRSLSGQFTWDLWSTDGHLD
jgi:hypothetical protein